MRNSSANSSSDFPLLSSFMQRTIITRNSSKSTVPLPVNAHHFRNIVKFLGMNLQVLEHLHMTYHLHPPHRSSPVTLQGWGFGPASSLPSPALWCWYNHPQHPGWRCQTPPWILEEKQHLLVSCKIKDIIYIYQCFELMNLYWIKLPLDSPTRLLIGHKGRVFVVSPITERPCGSK